MLALALGGFGIGTTEFVAMGLLPEMASGLGVSEPIAGHVISAYALGVVVGAPLIAALTARVPRRTLLIALMVAFTVGNAASVFAPSYTTLMMARFVAGLPHGAYFGVAALVAAHLAEPGKRAKAVAMVMMGLSVANVIGVPVAAWIGQALGWRSAFALVAVIGVATVASLFVWIPRLDGMPVTNPITELGALGRVQVWMTLIVGMVGFGGMFAVYTYISTTLTDVSGLGASFIPLALMLYGLGMVAGNFVGGYLADRALMKGLFLSMGSLVVILAVFVIAVRNPYTALVFVFLIGLAGSSMVPGLQTRLMDVAEDAQTLAASLNHAALNIANAFGAWIGGVVIAAGYGYTAPAAVGSLLAVAGLVVLAVAVILQRRAVR
ncbi:MFS transporter [Rhodococcus sp. WS1]|jgi:DHA1 family inner membrane transport protein|uniref:MFS transporter n=3 Tax=Nocardiaceae TaxID=85025 RepID=A0A1F2PQL1_RHOER|nr:MULTISPECIES: MFS transporter [Rhodococcus]MCD2154569.1 MFS transporter [Rhodococcus cerastii]MCW0194408.1 MFS transporter [Rhodococcus sp. (in: high G+C Gram-positive bacteria)]AGT91794.1 MFS transporter [Rhodococcus erythropolis CCM2595]ATI33935.1 MFS transporter [Rhodococcus sp. H-CA8f]MBH5146625.1 MFS transporter [Rhodococcus erythropolis]